MLPTASDPEMFDMSKHSINSGGDGKPRASCNAATPSGLLDALRRAIV